MRTSALLTAALAVVFPTLALTTATDAHAAPAPPSGGYFSLVPSGHFDALPGDAAAAALVHRSSWEPRPENDVANRTTPPAGTTTAGYSGMLNHGKLFGRVTGNFTGTTDEIIHWAAAKWGLPDEVVRAEAVLVQVAPTIKGPTTSIVSKNSTTPSPEPELRARS